MLTSQYARPDHVRMLEHELALRPDLDPAWAVRPIALAQHEGRAALVLEDPQGEQAIAPLASDALAFWQQPLETQPFFLRAAALENEGNWRALQPLAAEWARHDTDDPEPRQLLERLALRRELPPESPPPSAPRRLQP